MIEQTDLIVKVWNYNPPASLLQADERLTSFISFDVMKKRAADKKGIACRFSFRFDFEDQTVLQYVAEDSYVIDMEQAIDRSELQTMIRNSFAKFKEKFDLRKLGTELRDISLMSFDETKYDLEPILALLN